MIEALQKRAITLFKLQHYQEAVKAFWSLQRKGPLDTEAEYYREQASFRAMFYQAQEALESKKPFTALRLFEDILRQEPDNMQCLYGKGLSLYQLGKF